MNTDICCIWYHRDDVVNQVPDDRFVAAFGVCQDTEGKIILTKHHRRGREIPAGRREEGETIFDNVFREIREETGGDMIDPIPRAVIHRDNKDTGKQHYGVLFVGSRVDGSYDLVDDAIDMGRFSLAEVQELFATQGTDPGVYKLIEQYI